MSQPNIFFNPILQEGELRETLCGAWPNDVDDLKNCWEILLVNKMD